MLDTVHSLSGPVTGRKKNIESAVTSMKGRRESKGDDDEVEGDLPERPRSKSANILLIGESLVGKTSLFKFITEPDWTFREDIRATVAVSKPVVRHHKVHSLKFWDCGGQERFKRISQAFVKGSQGIIIVASLDSVTSFSSAVSWLERLRSTSEDGVVESVPTIFVVNKIDLDGQDLMLTDWKCRGANISEEYGVPFISTSAKEGTRVDALVSLMAHMQQERVNRIDATSKSEQVTRRQSTVSSCGCVVL